MALLSLAVSILDIFSLVALLYTINSYTQKGSFNRSVFLPHWLNNPDSILLVLLFLLFFIGKSFCGFLVYQAQNHFVYRVASRISKSNLLRYLEGGYGDYANLDSSVLIRKISQQPIEFSHYVLAGIQQIITEGILIVLTVGTILFFNATLFLFLFILLLPAVIIMSFFTKTRLRFVRAEIKTSGEKALQHLQEALSGYIESNLYEKNQFFTKRFADYQQVQNQFLADLVVTQGISSRLIEVFAVFGFFVLIVTNLFLGGIHRVELVTIGAFIAAAYKIIPGIVKIINVTGQIRTYGFTIKDLLLEEKKAATKKIDWSPKEIHSVSFSQVSLKYQDQEIVKEFSLEMKAGDFIGLSGKSGKGKTSIINALLGFMEPAGGHISINQVSYTSQERKNFWHKIAYVKQEAFLLYDTILNNITLDKDRFEENKLIRALAISGLEPLIGQFPAGVQKMITENGKNISGGQRQRITIARAIYKESDLIILDEPFNELDRQSEREILEHFKELCAEGKIVLLITHHPDSFSFCTKMVSLDE